MLGNNGSRLASWLISFLPMSRCFALKRWLLRKIGGMKVADGVEIWSGAKFYGQYISIGKNCHIGEDCFFAGLAPDAWLTIGDEVSFGPRVYATTGAHYLGSSHRRSGPGRQLPITIGNGAGICVNTTIAAGAVIGDGCQIMPNCVVSGVIKPNTLVMVAKPIKMSMPEEGLEGC